MNSRDDFRGIRVFEEIARGPGPDQVENILMILIHRQGNNPDMRHLPFNDPCGFHARHARHAHVHEDHVGQQLSGFFHGFAAILGFSDNLDVFFGLENSGQPLAHDTMIIRNQHLNFFCHFVRYPFWSTEWRP